MSSAVPYLVAAVGAAGAVFTGGSSLAITAGALGSAAYAKSLTPPKMPNLTPTPPPTIDKAKQDQQTQQRLQQRKGVLANIYGGSTTSSAPSVGTTSLLGQ